MLHDRITENFVKTKVLNKSVLANFEGVFNQTPVNFTTASAKRIKAI